MFSRLSYSILIILSSFLWISCGNDEVKRIAPDVSGIEAKVDLVRYDKALAAMDATDPASAYLKVLTQYPNMTDLYFKQLIRLHHSDHDTFNNRLAQFLTDDRITVLSDTVAQIYASAADIEKDLQAAAKYLKHYFPEKELPRFYTLFSEFSYQTFIFEDQEGKDAIGIGLDMFLGDDFDYKKIDPGNTAFSDYLTRTYNREHLVKKAIEMIVVDLLGQAPGKRFVDKMIHQGKKQYILEHLLPSEPDSILWEYTAEQMDWVKAQELEMWDFFLEQNLMYETSHLKIAHYLEPAPSSKGMPEIAPGRTAVYIGYKMVRSFMNRKPDMSLRDLVAYKDSQKLMEQAKYKPPRK